MNKKCPQCGLVNFASDEKCKRCDTDFSPDAAAEQATETSQPQSMNSRLMECTDCGFHHSQHAEACPRCGRFIQKIHVVRPAPAMSPGAFLNLKINEYLSGILFLIAIVVGFSGLYTLYQPEHIVGGDAFNYIIAGTRGVGLLILGLGFLILAVALDLRVVMQSKQ